MIKWQEDQHHSEREFEVGDLAVICRLKLYKQMYLKKQNKDKKLTPKYYCPYNVLKRIRNMDYKLEPPL
jgi:hypothetical protein